MTLSVRKKFDRTDGAEFETFFDIIETMAGMEEGELLLRDNEEFDAFSMVFVIGMLNKLIYKDFHVNQLVIKRPNDLSKKSLLQGRLLNIDFWGLLLSF